jgi:hypothetical protein
MGHLSRARAALAGLGLGLLLGGCAGYDPTPYWQIKETAFVPLVPGVHTKNDVHRLVGEPLVRFHFARLNEDVWEYRYIEGVFTVKLAWLSFDATSGAYKSAFHQLDPAYSGNDRGN